MAHSVLMLAVGLVIQGRVPSMALTWPVSAAVAGAAIAYICYAAAAVFFTMGVIRWALVPYQDQLKRQSDRVEAMLQLVSENIMISETAKRIAFREQDRRMLRDAIHKEVQDGNFDIALNLVEQMADSFGNEMEDEKIRGDIFSARNALIEQHVRDRIADIDQLLDRHEWENAAQEARRAEQDYSDRSMVLGQVERVRQAREDYKHGLERQFLEASQRDDVDRAMTLMRELDKYLTEKEAAPYREAARGVITKMRENLAVQFKLAVQDKEWSKAVRVGEEIMDEFSNTKMAGEVRGMIDTLRSRAVAEQEQV